jgi:glyoxylase-like metal-dependent hydrolase (beta-lactamase superfamily II)
VPRIVSIPVDTVDLNAEPLTMTISHQRPFLALVLVATAAAVAAVGGRQQPTGEPFSTAIRLVKPGLWVIPGYDGQVTGGNTAVRGTPDGVLIVDTRFGEAAREIVPKVKSVISQPIKYVLSTHSHNDHTGGNPLFAGTAELIAHRNVRENMIRGKQAAPPHVVFNDEASVFLGNVEVQLKYLGRGHTNGDAVIYFPDLKVVHTGDLVVWGKRTDGSILTPFADTDNGGSLFEWLPTLDRLLQIDFDTAIPGHGPVLTKNDVRAFRDKIATLRQRVTDLVQTRVPKKEFGAKLKTDDLSWPFPQARLDAMYDEIAARSR